MFRITLRTIALLAGSSIAGAAAALSGTGYPLPSSGQAACYDNAYEITCPPSGKAFYGQDAQSGNQRLSYKLSQDGKTVIDEITGLTWQHSPDSNGDGKLNSDDKLTWAQAQQRPAQLNAARYGGHSDWRMPTIKELYSLINFSGRDFGPPSPNNASTVPFIDTRYFQFAYGQIDRGERPIDSQYASSTLYVNRSGQGSAKLFGVNFADGRIKGYGLKMPRGGDKTFFVLCVRGNPAYGKNAFHDDGSGTITDRATGLMWSRTDSGKGMNWGEALAWAQTKNRENYLGHNDWRLPAAKELQSILDYSRSPDSSGSAAIDQFFSASVLTNEAGQKDYPAYWSSTTHGTIAGGFAAVYFNFGRSMGFMHGGWQDVHGAGAQRSDPKFGNPALFPTGRGPQGDAIRIYNFVRLVRNPK
jgi:hypothetical protein